jgi:hypothetical protein
VQRELGDTEDDMELLLLECMRVIDTLSWWQKSTMAKYCTYLQFLARFEQRYGVEILRAKPISKPPNSPEIPLMWAQLLYSLYTHKGQRIKFNTVWMLRSAVSLHYTWDLHMLTRDAYVARRNEMSSASMFYKESMTMFATKGMARRLGTQTKPSWALSYVHIAYMNATFHEAWPTAKSVNYRHEIACTATANLLGYLGWLRGTELFDAEAHKLSVILPDNAAEHELPPHVGAVMLNLLPETKSNPCQAANILSLLKHFPRLGPGELGDTTPAVSTPKEPEWTSRYFRVTHAWQLLEHMRMVDKEPSLQFFGDAEAPRFSTRCIICTLGEEQGGLGLHDPPPKGNPQGHRH